jgi:putative redox protein
MITVTWKGGMTFEGCDEEGLCLTLDASDDHAKRVGPPPLVALLSSLGGCSGYDVLTVLHKKRLTVTAYRVEIDAVQAKGEYPHPFTEIVLRHIVEGPDVTQEAVDQAVSLSDAKYCSAIATLRFSPTVRSEGRAVVG